MKPSWSTDLPNDLMEFLATKITSVDDFIRFRAVCHPWRSAADPRSARFSQLPWLLLPYPRSSEHGSSRRFYDMSTSRIHTIDLPGTHDADIVGSSHGWFLLCKGETCPELWLLNPITRETISLPPFTAIPSTIQLGPADASYDTNFLNSWNTGIWITKAILTSSPLDQNCTIILGSDGHPDWQLAFCNVKDPCWTVIQQEIDFPTDSIVWDFTYADGHIHTVNAVGRVTTYDFNNASRVVRGVGQNFPNIRTLHLVDDASGDLLLIISEQTPSLEGTPTDKKKYTVYSFNQDEGATWIKVTHLERSILFLASDVHAVSLSTAVQIPENLQNSLCYDAISTSSIESVSLYDGTTTVLAENLDPVKNCGCWQRSLWLKPSLR